MRRYSKKYRTIFFKLSPKKRNPVPASNFFPCMKNISETKTNFNDQSKISTKLTKIFVSAPAYYFFCTKS